MYFIKYSLKKCKVSAGLPQHPTKYSMAVILLKTGSPLTEHFHILTQRILEVAV